MIVGVDVSSHRIDLAWMENGRPCRWRQELAKGHLIDRLRSIRVEWPGRIDYQTSPTPFDVTEIAVEYPFGRGNAIAALMATVGIITRQAPPWARVAWPSSQELRAAIGSRNTKAAAHTQIRRMRSPNAPTGTWQGYIDDWDEHELDALVAAVGWQKILEGQGEWP